MGSGFKVMNDGVVLSLISAGSAIAVAYIVNIASKKVQARKVKDGPLDRMEQMFDGYERLIKQKDLEDDRKARLITDLKHELEMTRDLVRKLEASLAESQREIVISRQENQDLKDMLKTMREEYEAFKKSEVSGVSN